MKLFIIYCVLNIINVVLQTTKSLVTIKGSKLQASFMCAINYGLYQVILVLAVCELPLWLKVITVATANFIGVYITKTVEANLRKDKLWKVEVTIPAEFTNSVRTKIGNVPNNYIDIGKYSIFNFYCTTQEQSLQVKEIVKEYGAKYFVSESKVL